jgi:hypothetical protein
MFRLLSSVFGRINCKLNYITMKVLFFSILVTAISQITFAQSQVPTPNWQFRTDDTHLTIAVVNNRQVIYELINPKNGWNWTSKPSEVPLLNRVILGTTDTYNVNWIRNPNWIYQDAVVNNSDGYMVTLRFTSTNPKLELKSNWRARKGCGPVEHWMTVENNTGTMIRYSYWDVISSNLTVAANGNVKLWRFYRQPIGKPNGGLEATSLVANSSIISIISNEINHGDPETILPFEMMDVESTHGLYIGYGWDFGRFITSTGSNPHLISTMFNLGDIGTIVEDDGILLNIPYTFYGTYTGDVDDGSNKMKKWFWNYRMTETLRENKDEPQIELLVPCSDEARLTSYLKKNPLKSWGVDIIKLDVEWSPVPGHFKTWVNATDYAKIWSPDPVKWPNGLTFGAISHANNLKVSLYLNRVYHDVNLGTRSGRIAESVGRKTEREALLERFDKGWFDYWRSDENFDRDFSYLSHEGFLGLADFLIKNRSGFRWDCSGGRGCKKSFDIAERMTFLSIDDYARAHTYRMSYYGNSYLFNPAQLKADIAIDWGLGAPDSNNPSLEWDKYNFRTGLMGSMMVSSRERELDDQEEAVGRETWNLYQTKQRAILRGCDVYHILPFPDGVNWDGMQFFNTEINKGSVLLFKPSETAPDTKIIKLKGLDRQAIYTLTFQDRKEQNTKKTGAELMDKGIEAKGMSGNFASEIIWIN